MNNDKEIKIYQASEIAEALRVLGAGAAMVQDLVNELKGRDFTLQGPTFKITQTTTFPYFQLRDAPMSVEISATFDLLDKIGMGR